MTKSHSNPHYKISEVAERLGIGTRTVYTLISDGRLQSRLFGRARRVGEDQLQDFLKNSECKAAPSDNEYNTASELTKDNGARQTIKLPFMP